MHSLACLALGLLPLVAGHGFVTSPPARRPGSAYEATCGQQPFYQQSADINGNVQGIEQVIGSDMTAACNLWLCKGFLLADNTDKVQSFSLGQTIDFKVNIAAPHTGYANVSVVKTSSNSIIGEPLIEFQNYASNNGVAANNTAFSVTLPSSLDGDCTTAGDCVLQWYWDAPSIDQTYEACVDFTVGGSSGPSSGSGSVASTAVSTVVSTAASSTSTVTKSSSIASAASSKPTSISSTTAAPTTSPTAAVSTTSASTPTTSAAPGSDTGDDCPADEGTGDDSGDDDECSADDSTGEEDGSGSGDDDECSADEGATSAADAATTTVPAAVVAAATLSASVVVSISRGPSVVAVSNVAPVATVHTSTITEVVTSTVVSERFVTVTAAAAACH